MKFIPETTIETIAAKIGQNEETYQQTVVRFSEEYPLILAYLLSENFDVLTEEEKEYLLYLTTVIVFSAKEEGVPDTTSVTEKMIGEIEEKNWELLQASKGKSFRERVDVFFEKYPQEDLLAFVEDALVEDEDSFVTKVGRAPIFVALKSIIDTLDQA